MTRNTTTKTGSDPAVDGIWANCEAFEEQVRQAQEYFARNHLYHAAESVARAAHVATSNHCGVFWSPRLEGLLNAKSRRISITRPSVG
jgi:hypothetical protein